jgi:hypothetical protein
MRRRWRPSGSSAGPASSSTSSERRLPPLVADQRTSKDTRHRVSVAVALLRPSDPQPTPCRSLPTLDRARFSRRDDRLKLEVFPLEGVCASLSGGGEERVRGGRGHGSPGFVVGRPQPLFPPLFMRVGMVRRVSGGRGGRSGGRSGAGGGRDTVCRGNAHKQLASERVDEPA